MAKMFGMNRSESARTKWSRVIREQRKSGLSVKGFCGERNIPASSLFAWRRKLKSETGQSPAASVFVEAKIRGVDDGHSGGVMIELVGGRRIVVGPGFDRRVLLEVIQTLESGVGVVGARS